MHTDEVTARMATPDDAEVVARLLHDFNTEFDTASPGVEVLAPRLRALLAGDATFAVLAVEPAQGDPAAGDPAAGDPAAGDPAAGDPAAGDPAAGDPAGGDPAGGDPAVGVALVTLRPNVWYEGPVALLDELYVVPDRRSEGIGSEIVDHLLVRARGHGVGLVEINVDEGDVDAQRFYERHGFTAIEPDTGERAFYFHQELAP